MAIVSRSKHFVVARELTWPRRILRWSWMLAVLFVLLSIFTFWAWGQFAVRAKGAPSNALAVVPANAAGATSLDKMVEPLLLKHAQPHAAALINRNVDAYAVRVQSAREAGRSLDVQYYIWHEDLTGLLLKNELMSAAERGVRVRLLLDDISVGGRDELLLAMDEHPNLEVRLFNPARNRSTAWTRALEMGLRFFAVNRRMHNKAWIADGRVAIVGGRNIGDEYFDAADRVNFRDADLMLIGDGVAQASTIFDQFWNSDEVIPLRALYTQAPTIDMAGLQKARAEWLAKTADRPYVKNLLLAPKLSERLLDNKRLRWMNTLKVVSDPPQKAAPVAERRKQAYWLMFDVQALLYSAQKESWIISPYFVPGDGGTLMLAGQAARGVDVRVLTNSLSANDVPLVHAGYMNYREDLLASGVKLYELKRGGLSEEEAAQLERTNNMLGSSGASLHTKSFVIDGERGFVGSFNFDPRSTHLNTEMGVVFEDKQLAQELRAMFEKRTAPENCYRVTLQEGALHWQGQNKNWNSEPEIKPWKRQLVRWMSYLPLESQL